MSCYRVLERNPGMELRYYSASRRTIKVYQREYFLNFPPMVFGKCGSNLFAAFAEEVDGEIILSIPPLPNIYNIGKVCLKDDEDCGVVAAAMSLDDMIADFWARGFNDWIGDKPYSNFKKWFNSFSSWTQLSVEQVKEQIKEGNKLQKRAFTNAIWRRITGHDYVVQCGQQA